MHLTAIERTMAALQSSIVRAGVSCASCTAVNGGGSGGGGDVEGEGGGAATSGSSHGRTYLSAAAQPLAAAFAQARSSLPAVLLPQIQIPTASGTAINEPSGATWTQISPRPEHLRTEWYSPRLKPGSGVPTTLSNSAPVPLSPRHGAAHAATRVRPYQPRSAEHVSFELPDAEGPRFEYKLWS
jgi:hypothetical protein